MEGPTQSVIYRFDGRQDPVLQFYSMPESVVGGASNLDEGRAAAAEALRFSLDVEDLPEMREYVEEEVGDLGVWVRTPLDWHEPFKPTAHAIENFSAEDRIWLHEHRTAGGDPVVVPTRPDDLLGVYLSQMTEYDSLILAAYATYVDGSAFFLWLVIDGAWASADADEPATNLTTLGLGPEKTMREVFDVAMRHNSSRLALA